jgi:hypothetical protein
MKRVTIIAALALCLYGAPAAAQLGEPTVRASARELIITARLHAQFNTTTADDAPDTEWLIRRARLESRARINEVVAGHVQMEFAGDRATVMHAYMDLNLSPAVNLRAGRAFKPFGLFARTANTLFIPIEPGLRIRGVTGREAFSLLFGLNYGERGTGLQAEGVIPGAPMRMRYNVGWYEGFLARTPGMGDRDDHAFAGRLDAWPVDPIRVGASWSRRDFVDRDAAGNAAGPLLHGDAFALDFQWGGFRPGLQVMVELTTGVADAVADERFNTAAVWSAWRSAEGPGPIQNIEPLVRVSWADVSGGGVLFTPGINFYFAERNRVMLNYDVWSPIEGDRAGSFKVMFGMWF